MINLQKLSVETDMVKTDTDNMDENIKKIKKAGDDIKSNIISLNSMWEGEAKDAFVQQCDSDIKELYSIINDMEIFIKKWRDAKQKYDECEVRVGDLINAIKV